MNLYHIFSKKFQKDFTANVSYDRSKKIPVIRSSICTGEQVAGFKNIDTGNFEEVMLIQGEKDLADFIKKYKIDPAEIKKEW